ncbi:MAG: hypothetical protein WBC04_19825 [Candidatus Acidiferrales bacterium]
MRYLALVSGISFLLALSTPAQRHAHPPDLSKVVKQDPQPLDPPAVVRKGVDPSELKRDAAELQKLAVTVSEQVDQVTQNQLPKDLNDNLKRIEKLAKHLRSEISP